MEPYSGQRSVAEVMLGRFFFRTCPLICFLIASQVRGFGVNIRQPAAAR